MLMKKEVIEDNEKLKEEIKDLKKQLEEEKNAYNRMYNMYVEKDNIINELEKYLNYEYKHIRKNINFKEVLKKLQELKGSDKEWILFSQGERIDLY